MTTGLVVIAAGLAIVAVTRLAGWSVGRLGLYTGAMSSLSGLIMFAAITALPVVLLIDRRKNQ